MNSSSRAMLIALATLFGVAIVTIPMALWLLHPAVGFMDPSSARIVVLHVPMAWIATLMFIVSAVNAGRYLRSRSLLQDDASAAAAEIGLLCGILATITGSIFAHSQWGSWWNWDPRESSIFFLLLIYGAYFSLRGSVDDPARRALFSAVYDILACPAMLFLIFVMPRILPSLHPSRAHLDGAYWGVLLVSFAGFMAYLIQCYRIRLEQGRRRLARIADEPAAQTPLRATVVKQPESV